MSSIELIHHICGFVSPLNLQLLLTIYSKSKNTYLYTVKAPYNNVGHCYMTLGSVYWAMYMTLVPWIIMDLKNSYPLVTL